MTERWDTYFEVQGDDQLARWGWLFLAARLAMIGGVAVVSFFAWLALLVKGADSVGPAPSIRVATKIGVRESTKIDRKAEPKPIDFHREIKPIFVRHCFACHGPSKAESGLRLDMRDRALRGGDQGPAIIKGNAAGSRLIQYISGKSEDGVAMPPPGKAPPLSPEQIELLRAWIDQGAAWPDLPGSDAVGVNARSDHWAFRPVRNIKAPIIRDPWIDTPIDAFVLAKLLERQLEPNARASREDLIRRVTFDLIGLPPTPEEVQRFVNDPSNDAYERLVDRLLGSPRYGERWARHWLDLARYADSDGFENDTDRVNAYKYRDYVIRSFNDDKPYDQFIVEQLAGDELDDSNPENLIALGFCRNGPTIGNQINEKNRVDEIDDVVSTTSNVFLGLTIGCARCHDHKYEPISQRDYYRMFAIFNNIEKRADEDIMHVRDLKNRKTYVMLGGDFNRRGEGVEPGIPAVIDDGRVHFPPATRGSDLNSRDNAVPAPGRRLALARWIADPQNPLTARVIVNRIWMYHFGRGLVNSPSNFGQSGDAPTHLELLDFLARQFVEHGWQLKPLHKAIVMSATYRQSSDYDAISAGVDPDNSFCWRYPIRRLEAEEIRDCILAVSGKLNPLMYGPGIKPKIPDSIIDTGSKEMWPKVAREGPEEWRRSVYIFVKRSVLVPMLEGFDAPTATQTCERRMTTTVATQALQLLNDNFCNEQASYMAARVMREVGDDVERQVDRAYWLAFARAPTEDQHRQAAEFVAAQFQAGRQRMLEQHISFDAKAQSLIRQQALADLCHVLFNTNEFVYVN